MSDSDHIEEKDAVKQAKKDGIEFVDHFLVEGDETKYETREEAEKAADGKNITQVRERKQGE